MEENVELTLEQYFRETISKVMEVSKNSNKNHNANNEIVKLLTTFIEDLPKKIDTNKKLVSFDSPIEQILFLRSNPDVEVGVVNFPLHLAYHFLGIAYYQDGIYDDALENFLLAHEINNYYAESIFKASKCYEKTNDLDKMFNFLIDSHKYIYTTESLSKYYSVLGDYYYAIRSYEGANILYSCSEYYNSTGYNQQQLTNISKFLGRLLEVSTDKEILEFLKEKNIPIAVNKDVLNHLIFIYKEPADNDLKKRIKAFTKKILYGLTKNEAFSPSSYLRNDEVGFIFEIPETWNVVNRNEYNKTSTNSNTLFIVKPNNNVTININDIGECTEKDFKDKYIKFKNEYLNNGFSVDNESIVKVNGNTYIQAFISRDLLNEKMITMHNYMNINGRIIDFDIPVLVSTIDPILLSKDKNVIRLNNVMGTIQIITKASAKEEEFTFF